MTQHYHNIWHFYLLKIQVAYQSTILPDANGTSDADLGNNESVIEKGEARS